MKKNLIIGTSVVSVIILGAVYFYFKNIEDKKKLIPTQPYAIAALRESLETKGVDIKTACENPVTLSSSVLDLSKEDLKKRFTFLCEDYEISKKLEENFGTSTDYKYFLNCAKSHFTNMQQIMSDLKEHYPADYKDLNFSKENQEKILMKYLKHPNTAYLMAQCEAKTEALYWRSIINSGKVEDLKFCVQTTEDCLGGKTKSEECPANVQAVHDECSKKLGEMKH